MLADHDAGRWQLRDLTTTRTPRRHLLIFAELVPAPPTALRVMIDELVDVILALERTAGTLVPRLAASATPLGVTRKQLLRSRPRLGPTLLTRLRGILRRRLRPRTRTLPRLLLETPDPLLQPPSLPGQPLHRRGQLENDLNTPLPPRVINSLSLRPLHTNQFDKRTEVPSPQSRQLNAYPFGRICSENTARRVEGASPVAA